MNRRYRKGIPRRDLCGLVGRRAQKLDTEQSSLAWQTLAKGLEELQGRDIPKFADLLGLIRGTTLAVRKVTK